MKAVAQNDFILTTPNISDDQEAIAWKLKQIHPKLFGLFCPVKYQLVSKEKVQVPYQFMVFDYRLVRSTKKRDLNKKSMFNRQGEVAVVFDMNEAHAFHFDLFDDLRLQKKKTDDLEGEILVANCSDKEAFEQSVECIKWQYLRKIFHAIPELTLIKKECFYREAWRLTLQSHGRRYEKFAYRDRFGAENEHISGLRVRLTT